MGVGEASSAIPKTHCRYVMLPLRVEAGKLPPFLNGGRGDFVWRMPYHDSEAEL